MRTASIALAILFAAVVGSRATGGVELEQRAARAAPAHRATAGWVIRVGTFARRRP